MKYSPEEKREYLDHMRIPRMKVTTTYQFFKLRDGTCPHVITLRRWKKEEEEQRRSTASLVPPPRFLVAPMAQQAAPRPHNPTNFHSVFVSNAPPNYFHLEQQFSTPQRDQPPVSNQTPRPTEPLPYSPSPRYYPPTFPMNSALQQSQFIFFNQIPSTPPNPMN